MKRYDVCIMVLCIFLFAGAVRFHSEIAAAVITAGTRCVLVIIPSLYLFSVLAAFCIRTGLLEAAAARLNRFSRRILHMDAAFLLILVFSQIGGYPVGVQLIQQLRQKSAISEAQAQRMLCCCFGCGPAFLLGTVGGYMELPHRVCVLLMLSVMLPNLLIGLYTILRCGEIPKKTKLSLAPAEFSAAVESGAAAMLKICSMILIFAALMGMFSGLRFWQEYLDMAAALLHCRPQLPKSACAAFFEISNLTEFLRQGGSLPAAAAFLSFGGLCVHMQNAAICGEAFPWLRFWIVRGSCAFSSYWICRIGLHFMGGDAVLQTFRQVHSFEPALTQGSILPVLCLFVMALLLLNQYAELRIKSVGDREKSENWNRFFNK